MQCCCTSAGCAAGDLTQDTAQSNDIGKLRVHAGVCSNDSANVGTMIEHDIDGREKGFIAVAASQLHARDRRQAQTVEQHMNTPLCCQRRERRNIAGHRRQQRHTPAMLAKGIDFERARWRWH